MVTLQLSEVIREIILHIMEVSPFGLSKVARGEEMDILRETVWLPNVKK